jgi:hypothetical protein
MSGAIEGREDEGINRVGRGERGRKRSSHLRGFLNP